MSDSIVDSKHSLSLSVSDSVLVVLSSSDWQIGVILLVYNYIGYENNLNFYGSMIEMYVILYCNSNKQ